MSVSHHTNTEREKVVKHDMANIRFGGGHYMQVAQLSKHKPYGHQESRILIKIRLTVLRYSSYNPYYQGIYFLNLR